MRIIASADHHFAETQRWEECLRIHAWMAEEVARQAPSLFVSCGDIYERASTPCERAAVADWLTRVAETCPVLIAKGNHDRRLDLAILSQLRARNPIFVEERCGIYVIAGAAIAAVAWPNRASIASMVDRRLPSGTTDNVTRACYQDVLRGLGEHLEQHSGPRLLVTHAMIRGSTAGTGQPLIGSQMVVGPEDLALARADITIAGHVHMPQHFEHAGRAIVYTGSPYRRDFGEAEDKSLLRIDFDAASNVCGCVEAYPRGSCPTCPNRGVVRWDRIPSPARPMVLLVGEWEAGLWKGGLPGLDAVPARADVRFRYVVSLEEQAAAWHGAVAVCERLLEAGAATIKVERQVEPRLTPRVTEPLVGLTMNDKLRLLWETQKRPVSEPRAARLLARYAELDQEHRDSIPEMPIVRGGGMARALAAPLAERTNTETQEGTGNHVV
ncbi:metallophosphoesterase family protein [Pendulispora brunnea]|uniref:Metallophosphoesterase family protein n=1 Tax=Pendulispora brunnea TaxID=2905690 RepID=A0ABZ2KKI3_9BACT